MASAKLRKKTENNSFLSPEQTRTIKPADFRQHQKLRDLSHEDLIELLCLMEAELQAKDVLLKAVLVGKAGVAHPLSHLLNDAESATLEEPEHQIDTGFPDEEDEIWLGEPSAHLNHVSAYHQVVREQMHSIVQTLQQQHKQAVDQLDDERHKHACDTAQGDDVTYMLEKERERLQMQIDVEQAKYIKLEKERDALLKLIETERQEQYNTFNSLMNDCKAFALQLVEQSSKFEKYKKEIDKEKQKNKVLSELMVNETQKFKEKLKVYEVEVNDFYVVEQKKADLEGKLVASEKQCKETYRQLNEERNKNNKLRYQLNQMRKQLPADYVYDIEDGGENDVLFVQNQVEIPIREAKTSYLPVSNEEDRESPDPRLQGDVGMQPATMMVQSSPTIKQSSKVYIPQSKGIVVSVNSMTPKQLSYDSQKRHSFEERKYNTPERHYDDDEMSKRNSLESLNHVVETSHTAQIRNTSTIVKGKHNSFEEVRNVGTGSLTPKRNSYEGDSKRVPPPAPPRRGSALSTDKPPVVKVPHQLQPTTRKSASGGTPYTPNRGVGNADTYPLTVLVVCGYGWEYEKDFGLRELDDVYDFLSFVHVKSSCTWYELTCLVNDTFEKDCAVLLNEDEGVSSDSIASYKYGKVTWTIDKLPEVSLHRLLSQRESHIIVTLKGVEENALDDLSYSTMISIQPLEDCLRIITQEKRMLLTVNREVEGEHFAACVANWIKTREDLSKRQCIVTKVDRKDENSHTLETLSSTLQRHGVLQAQDGGSLPHKYILLLNLDYIEDVGYTPTVFDWLTRSTNNIYNGYNNMQDESVLQLHRDTLVIAYATNDREVSLTQMAYRLFKIMSLPSLLPDLVHRWLTQRLVEYAAETAVNCNMLETVKWLANVHQCLQKSFFKIELEHQLPDINIYMNAPLTNSNELHSWIEDFWCNHITPCVEESVRQRTGSAVSEDQQKLLIKATLQALMDKSIRPGCPIEICL